MKGQFKVILVVVVAIAVSALGYYAMRGGSDRAASVTSLGASQAPGGVTSPGGFQQFRESHKFTFQLTRLAANIGRLDSESKVPLGKLQAKAVLAVLTPLRKQESLDQEQAKAAIRQLQDILTEEQRTAIGALPPEHEFARKRPPSGQPPQGQRPPLDLSAMEKFNPFNPPNESPMARNGVERWDKLFEALEEKAGGT